MAPHVLVADDDAWILRMVATVLEKRGYSVETAVDGEDALARALARVPDLLITDVMMPKMDGWSLVRQLRSHAELAMLPVIFLTALSSEDDRIRGFRLGADDYVTKPFRFEELDLRVAKTLRRTAAAVQEARDQLGGSSLRGDLSQVGLSSLLVLIEMERKTGLLQLRAPNGPSAQVLVREGKVVHARLDEADEPVDAECVYYLLTWGAGEFEFTACIVEGADRVASSTTHLLMEGARLMDEASDVAHHTETASAAALDDDAALEESIEPEPAGDEVAAASASPPPVPTPPAPPPPIPTPPAAPPPIPTATSLAAPPPVVEAAPAPSAAPEAPMLGESSAATIDSDELEDEPQELAAVPQEPIDPASLEVDVSVDSDPPTTVNTDEGWG